MGAGQGQSHSDVRARVDARIAKIRDALPNGWEFRIMDESSTHVAYEARPSKVAKWRRRVVYGERGTQVRMLDTQKAVAEALARFDSVGDDLRVCQATFPGHPKIEEVRVYVESLWDRFHVTNNSEEIRSIITDLEPELLRQRFGPCDFIVRAPSDLGDQQS